MPEGWKTITIKEEVFDKMLIKHKDSETSQKPSPWVSDYLLMNFEKDDLLKQQAPSLELIAEPSDVMYIKNHKDNKIVEIRIGKNGKLVANDDDPIYLQFAWALPEISKLKLK